MSTEETTMLFPGPGAADTVRLEPTTTDVTATVALPTRRTPIASNGPVGFARALRGRLAAVAIGIAILGLFLGLLFGGVFSFSSPPRQSDAPPASSTSTTTSSTTTTTLAPTSVASTAGNVASVLNAAMANGTVVPAAGQQLVSQLLPLTSTAPSEPAGQQIQQFDGLVQNFNQDLADKQITGKSIILVRRAIRRLAVALGTTVPTATTTPTTTTPAPTPTPPGPKGHGPGKGAGKGPGPH
jgi:hypothetical protein